MNSLLCKIIGHKYSKNNNSTIHINDYVCKNCNQKFTTDGYGTIVKLTSFWKENNLQFEKYVLEKGI